MSCVGCSLTTQGPYHIEVCMSCVGCLPTTQGPYHIEVCMSCVTSRCVCLVLGVHQLHKDLASHIEVCMSCVGCPLTTQGPYHIEVCMSCVECPATTQGPCQSYRGVYVLCWVSTDYTRTLPVTLRCVCLVSGVHRLHKDLITLRCVCLVLGVH